MKNKKIQWAKFKFPPINLWVMPTIVLAFLVGCASEKEMMMAYQAQENIVKAQTMVNTPPLFKIKCDTSCQGLRFEYTPTKQAPVVPTVTNNNDLVKAVAPNIVTGVGYIAGGLTAIRVMDKLSTSMGGGNVKTTNITSVVGDSNNTSPVTTITDNTNRDDNSVIDNSTDNTAEPTVVTQPSPVIEVVNPITVDPVIVKPEVIQ